MPLHVPAGLVRVTLRNAGHDLHEATVARFTNDQGTAALYRDSIRANVDFPSFAEDVGGARLTMPGDSGTVWLRLTPGHYVVACWKGDHLSRGMVQDLFVDPPEPSRAVPPAMPVGGVGDLLPGAEAWMRVRLEPGRYALLCQVPSTSHGGRPHYKLGMVREFVVADSDRPPNDPKTN